MELTKITECLYRTEAMPTAKRVVQVIGRGTVSVWVSVDGEAFSQHTAKSVVGSLIIVVDLPIEGTMYVQMESKDEPTIIIL